MMRSLAHRCRPLILVAVCWAPLALADTTKTETTTTTKRKTKKTTAEDKTAIVETTDMGADNTARNDPEVSRQGQKPTADQASNSKSDLQLTAQIRRSVIADRALSISAHNVKIIVTGGVITLKGPVKTAAEKAIVAKKAAEIGGAENVRDQIEIAP